MQNDVEFLQNDTLQCTRVTSDTNLGPNKDVDSVHKKISSLDEKNIVEIEEVTIPNVTIYMLSLIHISEPTRPY